LPDLLTVFSFGDQGWGDEFLHGMLITAQLAVTAFLLGTVLGLLGAGAKLSPVPPLRWLAEAYTTVVRGVPEMLVLLLLFYGGTSALKTLGNSLGFQTGVDVDAFTAGVAALGLVNGAYSTELFRGAILSVPKGQIDAARAIGMAPFTIFRRILFPQVLRYALPGLSNLWQVMLKDTSLVSVIGLADLLRIGHVASGSTRMPFTFYLAVAFLFLVLTAVSMIFFTCLERYLNRGYRQL